MANKLRRRLILVSMASMLVVLTVIILAINLSNFATVRANADAVVDTLAMAGGSFDNYRNQTDPNMPLPPNLQNQNELRPNPRPDNRWLDEETPFDTRFFTVDYRSGTPTVDLDDIASIDEQTALQMAEAVRKKGATYGYYNDFRYKSQDDMVIFVDCSKQLRTTRQFLYTSLYVSAAATLAVFVLVFFLSKVAVEPIVQAYEKQKQFITEASHELKTPLTIISANNELTELESGETQSTKAIDKQVKRMTQMVKNMVALSRLDETATLQDVHEFSLSDSLTETVDSMQAALASGERTVSTEIQEGIVYKGNEDLVRQLYSILLENAAKYAQSNIHIRLTKGRAATLSVSNDARDLPDGNMSQCFERFYRSPAAREMAEGNGIGLAIAKQIALLHHAQIGATAKDGVFCVTVTF